MCKNIVLCVQSMNYELAHQSSQHLEPWVYACFLIRSNHNTSHTPLLPRIFVLIFNIESFRHTSGGTYSLSWSLSTVQDQLRLILIVEKLSGLFTSDVLSRATPLFALTTQHKVELRLYDRSKNLSPILTKSNSHQKTARIMNIHSRDLFLCFKPAPNATSCLPSTVICW